MQDDILERLLDKAEDRISAAMASIRDSGEVDLSDLIVELEEICSLAIGGCRRDVMPRLSDLIAALTRVEDELRLAQTLVETSTGEISHRQAAGVYGSVSTIKPRS